MPQRNSILEWETLLDETEWAREESLEQLLATQPPLSEPPKKPSSTLTRAIAGIALLALLLGAVYVWLEAQKGVTNIEGELRDMVEI